MKVSCPSGPLCSPIIEHHNVLVPLTVDGIDEGSLAPAAGELINEARRRDIDIVS
jgi:hypothetical protein